MNGLREEYDLIVSESHFLKVVFVKKSPFHVWYCQIVGAGLSGSVVAQQASERFGKKHSLIFFKDYIKCNIFSGLKSLVIDKRPHIGGNCFDFINEFGIRVITLDNI